MKDSSQGPRTDWKVPIDPFVLREEDGRYEEDEEYEPKGYVPTLDEIREDLAEAIKENNDPQWIETLKSIIELSEYAEEIEAMSDEEFFGEKAR